MPDNNYVASFYFVTLDNEGWSENIYIQAVDIDGAATMASGYIGPRMALSPDNVDMVYGKVSDVTIKGDSKIVLPVGQNYPFIGTWVPTPPGSYLEANTALLIQMTAGPSQKNHIFLRGLSLDIVTGREFKDPTGFHTVFNTWANWLRSNAFVRTKDLVTPGMYDYNHCTDAFFNRVTARKPGRPFGAPRGRRFTHRTAAVATAVATSSTSSVPPTKPSSVSAPARRR